MERVDFRLSQVGVSAADEFLMVLIIPSVSLGRDGSKRPFRIWDEVLKLFPRCNLCHKFSGRLEVFAEFQIFIQDEDKSIQKNFIWSHYFDWSASSLNLRYFHKQLRLLTGLFEIKFTPRLVWFIFGRLK